MAAERTLALPDHGVKLKQDPDGVKVFDPSRRRWLLCTPEEWVRQHFLLHLVHDLECPLSLIRTEHALTLNGMTKRADIVVHGTRGEPVALVECKAPDVALDQAVFDQAARYNRVFRVKWLLVTNGLQHYCCVVDHEQGSVRFLPELPRFAQMCT